MVTQPYEELIETSARKKPSAPDLIVPNESAIPRYISNILLIPDAFFSVNGVVTAEIGNRTIIAEAKPGALKLQKTHSFNILNEVLNPYEELRLYCWNGLSSDQISGTFIFTISDDPITGETQAEARSQLELNQEVSLNPEVSPEGEQIIESINGLLRLTDDALFVQVERVIDFNIVKNEIDETHNLQNPSNEESAEFFSIQDRVYEICGKRTAAAVLEIVRYLDNYEYLFENNNVRYSSDQHSLKQRLLGVFIAADIQREIRDAINDNTELVAELEAVKGAIEAQELEIGDITIDQQGVIDKLTELQAALPDSPDDTDTVAELQALIDKIQESITAINEVKNSVDGQELTIDQQATLDKLEELRLEYEKQLAELKIIEGRIIPDDFGIEDAIEKTLVPNGNITQAQIDAFGLIYGTLRDLQDGFDLNELEKAIEILKENVPIIEAVISEALHIEYLQLIMRLQATHETFPSLKSAQSGFLFPFQTYYNEEHTALVDVKGNKNFIIIMAASSIPQIEAGEHDPAYLDLPQEIHQGRQGTAITSSGETGLRFDFIDNLLKIPKIIYTIEPPDFNGILVILNVEMDYSNDPDFLDGSTELAAFVGSVEEANRPFSLSITGAETSKRYVRVRTILTWAIDPDYEFPQNIGESDLSLVSARAENIRNVGGRAALFFDIRDANNVWQTFIHSNDIGTLIAGGAPVIARFGRDVNNLIIPSSQSLLRARLKVTGGIETSITLILVA